MRSAATKTAGCRVRFGDVVRLCTDRCADPAASGIDRFVGLEHLEPGDLRVRKWGLVADGTTFTNRFKPGQVLFGKRRAYQRKVAVADFEGVCSGDIYVLEPSNGALYPELLPFICQTDAFFEHAVGTSAGSLSPRTNWKSLADFEFFLPPVAVQQGMVRVLLASSTNLAHTLDLYETTRPLARVVVDEAIAARRAPFRAMRWKRTTLGQLATVTKLAGFEYTKHVKYCADGEIIAIRPLNIKNGRLVLDDIQRIPRATSDALPRSKVHRGDVVITYIGMYIGEVLHIEDDDRFHLAPNIARITPTKEISGRLLTWLLRSSFVQGQIRSRITGTYTLSLTMASVRKLQIAFPEDLRDQERLADLIGRAWRCHLTVEGRLDAARRLHSRLVNQLLGDGAGAK